MKTENDFNRYLSKELSKFHPHIHHFKASDKFTAGVSDFILWGRGTSLALEVKFIKDFPKGNGQLLKHPFTGAQKTFMESIELAHHTACGLIAVGANKSMYLVPHEVIPENGNWTWLEFNKLRIDLKWFYWSSLRGMLELFFGGRFDEPKAFSFK